MESILKDESIEHLRNHLSYPVTRDELLKACSNMSDVPAEDRRWVEKTLPEGTYRNTDEVIRALVKNTLEHVKQHVTYPTTKNELVAACNKMYDVPEREREWFKRVLPDRTYRSSDEVIRALGL